MLVPWHMMNVPAALQDELLLLASFHVPTTIPLLKVPVVEVVPLEVPVRPSTLVRVRTFPGIVVEVTV